MPDPWPGQPFLLARPDEHGTGLVVVVRDDTLPEIACAGPVTGADPREVAGLALATEFEAVPGGTIRGRHTLTNTGGAPHVVDSLEVVFPLPATVAETLDFTGRETSERQPQRRPVTDGLWLRAGRRGRTGRST
jgi:alpha-galactosidase